MTIPATSKRVSSASVLVRAHLGTCISPSMFPPRSFLKATSALVQFAFQSLSTGKVFDRRSKSSQALQMLKNGTLLLKPSGELVIQREINSNRMRLTMYMQTGCP